LNDPASCGDADAHAPAHTGPTTLDAVRRRYLDCLLVPDGAAAWETIAGALAAGIPPRAIYLSVLGPAMEEIGALWEMARLGVAQEHLATQITQTVLARLAPSLEETDADADANLPHDAPRRLAIVAGTPGELHAIGARMVADFLEAAGWDVLLLGVDAPAADIVALARERAPDVVALSTSLPFNLLAAGRVFAALRALDLPLPLLVAGGRAYEGQPDRALVAGADLFATDPDSLLRELALRLH
jgi:MerR family transcriptional regulator, light-induced transcriptional regulator